MGATSIEWTDATWNPVAGCSLVSPGCTNCYAMRMAARLEAMGQPKYVGLTRKVNGHHVWTGKVTTDDAALMQPLSWRKPRRVFVNSMSDLFHEAVPFEFVDRVFAVMALTPQHTYQILTKRPERMAEYLEDRDVVKRIFGPAISFLAARDVNIEFEAWVGSICSKKESYKWPLPNVWLGTSVEDQSRADERIPHLLRCPAVVRFLSVEPMLGPIDLTRLEPGKGMDGLDCLRGGWHQGDGRIYEQHSTPTGEHGSISWVIVGGESGPGARPMHPQWARDIRDQCQAAGVPYFFKQWGEWVPFDNPEVIAVGNEHSPVCLVKRDGRVIRPYCYEDRPGQQMVNVGKKAAGRMLDGRTWDEFPSVSAGLVAVDEGGSGEGAAHA